MSFWDTGIGSVLKQIGYNATGGIIGQSGKTVSLSDVLAAGAYVYGGTPQGQQIIADSAGTYVGATAKQNTGWLLIIGVLTALLLLVTFSKK